MISITFLSFISSILFVGQFDGFGFGSLGDGSIDPFNKNNKLGVHIETPIRKPGSTKPTVSGLTVMSWSVDENGNVWESSRSDRPMVRTGKKAELKFEENGRAYWLWQGQRFYASARYDSQDIRSRFEEEKRRQEREASRKELSQINAMLLDDKLFGDVEKKHFQSLETSELIELTNIVKGWIAISPTLPLDDSKGLTKFLTFLRRELEQRFVEGHGLNSVLYSERYGLHFNLVTLIDGGTLGIVVQRDPLASSPATGAHIRSSEIICGINSLPIHGIEEFLVAKGTTTLTVISNDKKSERKINLPD